MNEEEIIFNANEDIIMQIEMMSYMEYNDQIATANDYLGEVYSYQDIEDMKTAQLHYEKELSYKAIKQLQEELSKAYKEKEDKIRECCMPLITLNNIDCCKECGSTNIKQNYKPYKIAEDILQILNEGDK